MTRTVRDEETLARAVFELGELAQSALTCIYTWLELRDDDSEEARHLCSRLGRLPDAGALARWVSGNLFDKAEIVEGKAEMVDALKELERAGLVTGRRYGTSNKTKYTLAKDGARFFDSVDEHWERRGG